MMWYHKLFMFVGICAFTNNQALSAEIWSCKNLDTGRTVYTVAPAYSTKERCSPARLSRSSYGRISAKAFERVSQGTADELSRSHTAKQSKSVEPRAKRVKTQTPLPWSYQARWGKSAQIFPSRSLVSEARGND